MLTEHGTIIASCPVNAKGNPNTLEWSEAEANAKLIAAAPELLYALKDADTLIDIIFEQAQAFGMDDEFVTNLAQLSVNIHEAIAKAEDKS